jgi:pre-peptidase/metallopeptidase family M12-like protein
MRSTRFRRTVAALGAGTVVFTALAIQAGGSAGAREPDPGSRVLDRDTPGRTALTEVGSRLSEIAARNGQTPDRLRAILAGDRTSWLDRDGRLYYTEPVAPAATREAKPAAKPKQQLADAFELHSKPGSNRVIYLDFTGHTITGTAWNASKGIDPVNVTPYDTDGNPGSFSAAEQAAVTQTWQRVAEDYAPFDVDVTTQDPGAAAINRSSSSDTVYGTRVLVDPTSWYQSGCGCGGVAYVGVYDSANNGYHQPALVFTRGVGTGAKNIAEAASHEAGHNLGLSHDGTGSTGYYAGHGAWAPIMGVGYSKAITQWSRGEYSGANNTQDDYAVIGQNGVAVRPADFGTSLASASTIGLGQTISGVNAALTDVDYFKITVPSGTYTFTANAAAVGGNLDIQLTLYNGAGSVLGTYDPASGQSNASTPTGLGASTRWTLNAGTYYVRVDDIGFGNPLNTGYSTYGSAGAFTLQVVAS